MSISLYLIRHKTKKIIIKKYKKLLTKNGNGIILSIVSIQKQLFQYFFQKNYNSNKKYFKILLKIQAHLNKFKKLIKSYII